VSRLARSPDGLAMLAKYPRKGSMIWSVLEELRLSGERGMGYGEIVRAYQAEQSARRRHVSHARHVAMNVSRALRAFARKTGKPGSHAPWVWIGPGSAPGTDDGLLREVEADRDVVRCRDQLEGCKRMLAEAVASYERALKRADLKARIKRAFPQVTETGMEVLR